MLISSSSHCIPQVDMANIPLTRLSFANSLVRCFDDIENRDTPPNLCVLHIFFLSELFNAFLFVGFTRINVAYFTPFILLSQNQF